MEITDTLAAKIATLQDALDKAMPNFRTLLSDIHTALADNPACVTLINDDQIATIVAGLSRQASIDLEANTVKPRKKAAGKLSEDDI